MDFGVRGLEGIVGTDNGHGAPSLSSIPYETQTLLSTESKPIKRSLDSADEDELKSYTVPKTDYLSTSTTNTMSLHQATSLLRTNSLVSTDHASLQNQMINFCLRKSEVPHMYSTRYAGYGSATVNASMHGLFTPSQMIELQHHALIYKYISCNMRVPSNLLIPLKKSIYPYGFTSSPARPLACNSLGWGSFHLRYTGKADPEPGRCRRMDGKKWRCSRDAVANRNYCERHLNRGRNRSVEGQTRHAPIGTTSSNVVPSMNTIAGVANSLAIARQHQFKSLQSGATPDTIVNRMHDQRGLSVFASDSNLKSTNSTFTITKQGVAFGESSVPDFRHVASGSLVNPLHRSYYTNSKERSLFLDITSQETQDDLKRWY